MSSESDYQERGVANGRLTFAFKLWEVANDGRLIRWNSSGDGVVVEQREYEENVHELYPRFVQNSSFLNLKRLFRDYGFQRNILRRKNPHGSIVEYTNPLFQRDNYENIINMTAKERVYKYKSSRCGGYRTPRKYTRRFPVHQSVFDADRTPSRRIVNKLHCPPRKRGRPPTRLQHPTTPISSSHDFFSYLPRKRGRPRKNPQLFLQQQLTPFSSANSSFSEIIEASLPCKPAYTLTDDDMFHLFQIFAKNELSEEEYVEAIFRKFGHKLEHLMDSSFEDLINAINEMMHPGMSPFCDSGIVHEYSLEDL